MAVRVVAAVSAVVLASFVGLPADGATVARSASSHETFDLTYTPGTVVVPATVVTQQLSMVSADGNTFTFKSAAAPLSSLEAGKVMLLEGKAVGVVTAVEKSGGTLVVTTRQPTITDIIKSGTIDVNAPITFAAAVPVRESEPAPDVTFKTTRLPASTSRQRGPREPAAEVERLPSG